MCDHGRGEHLANVSSTVIMSDHRQGSAGNPITILVNSNSETKQRESLVCGWNKTWSRRKLSVGGVRTGDCEVRSKDNGSQLQFKYLPLEETSDDRAGIKLSARHSLYRVSFPQFPSYQCHAKSTWLPFHHKTFTPAPLFTLASPLINYTQIHSHY